MKQFIAILAFVFTALQVIADPISDSIAKIVGINFFATRVKSQRLGTVSNLKLAYQAIDRSAGTPITCFYVYNASSTKGFIIVSADDNTKPILGYSDESNFDTANMPIQLREWLGGYSKQISSIIRNKIPASDSIKSTWTQLKSPSKKNTLETFGANTMGTVVVAPLIKTTWDQGPYYNGSTGQYNALCPFDSVFKGRCVTGCGATAMAQVMKYWNYPNKGFGFNSYIPSTNTYLGIQSSNFGNTTYQWSSMPEILTSSSTDKQINAVATLMYHCGVSINMDYGFKESISNLTGGKKYHPIDEALKTYFGYDSLITSIWRNNYSDTKWISFIENELNNNRPVIYRGSGTDGGHLFIADGYDNKNYIHFNWGWSGTDNGYFNIDSLNPGNPGIGGGSGGYNSEQIAIIGIQPATQINYNINLYTSITPSLNPISYASSFKISTNVANKSVVAFAGDFCAAIFDDSLNFVDYVQILSSKTLQSNSHYTNGLTFSNTGLYNMVPGTYYVGIYYRPSGGNWTAVSDNGTYTNFTQITVTNGNTDIVLVAPITATPSTFTQGKGASISLNIKNNQLISTFYGQYKVNLYNSDGSFAQNIGTYYETKGLSPGGLFGGGYYTSPLVFNTNSISVAPGTYTLAVIDSGNATSGWVYTGSGNYKNPIIINVQAPPLNLDKYEANDSISKAYLLPMTFVNDSAYTNTLGSNIHIGTDNDYYKIILPKGYSYSIKPILNDQQYSRNGNSYTLFGLFSYSKDSTTWSGTFEDTLKSNFTAKGGQTIYFHVAPSYQGQTGTYLMELSIKRTSPIVGGSILTPNGQQIPNVLVHARSPFFDTTITATGSYNVKLIGVVDTITVKKDNDLNKSNGVNGTDISLIQSHILKKVILNSPYKLIAADVNSDRAVNGTDIALIKSLILKRITTFTGNKLWAFIDSNYTFPVPTNPFPFNSGYTFSNTTSNLKNVSFIGVKLGDVNYDWNAAVLGIDGNTGPIELFNDNIAVNNSTTEVRVPIRVKNFRNIMGMQYTLNFNKDVLELKSVENNQLSADYNLDFINEGKLPVLWVDAASEPRTLADSTILFELVFNTKGNFTSENIGLSSDITEINAFDGNYKAVGIVKVDNTITANILYNIKVYPNPVKNVLTLNGNHINTIQVIDNMGKIVKVVSLKDATNPILSVGGIGKGVYHLRVQTTDGKQITLGFVKE